MHHNSRGKIATTLINLGEEA